MKKIFINLIGKICMIWWSCWSTIRFKDCIRHDKEIEDEDRVYTLEDIKALVKKFRLKFEWTADGADQLWDAITPPPQNYFHYKQGILKDDCDGFHSLVYHCLYNSGIKCYLMSVNAINGGHCVLLFQLDGKWYVDDYGYVYPGFDTYQEAITNYNKEYQKDYKTKPVLFNGFITYDYEDGKFHVGKIKE